MVHKFIGKIIKYLIKFKLLKSAVTLTQTQRETQTYVEQLDTVYKNTTLTK